MSYKAVVVALSGGGNRVEVDVDLESMREHFDECQSNGANPDMEGLTFEEWIAEVSFPSNGIPNDPRHFLFGWLEAYAQSGETPMWLHETPLVMVEVRWL